MRSRALVFLLFQTGGHAGLRGGDAADVLAAARAHVPYRGVVVPHQSPGRALDLRHPASRRRRREHPVDAAHRAVQAQFHLGNACAHPVLPAARVRRQEGAPVHPVLRLGLRARIADHHRPQGRHRRDAPDRGAGPRAVPPGILDRHLSGRHADPRGHAVQVQDRRREARHRARRADTAGRAQRRLPVAEGRLREAARNRDDLVRQADSAGRQGCADADARKPRRGSRPKSRGSGSRRAADESPPASAGHFRRPSQGGGGRGDEGASRRIVLAGESVDYRLVRARRRSIGMQIGLAGPHRSRAALGDDTRDRRHADRARRMDPAFAGRMARAAARRPAARMEDRRADPLSGPRTGACRAHRAHAGNRGRPPQPHRAPSRRRGRAAGRRLRRPLAARGSGAPASPAGGRIRGADHADAPRSSSCPTPARNGGAATRRA